MLSEESTAIFAPVQLHSPSTGNIPHIPNPYCSFSTTPLSCAAVALPVCTTSLLINSSLFPDLVIAIKSTLYMFMDLCMLSSQLTLGHVLSVRADCESVVRIKLTLAIQKITLVDLKGTDF